MVELGTLTTESVCDALLFRITQCRQRIGGLAGLRNEDRQIPLAQRRFAVAEFGGDIEFDRQTAEPFEPVLCDIAGIAGGAAGDDRDALDIFEIERQFRRQRHALGRQVDVVRQSVADHFRLLVDFLGHEVAVIGLVDQRCRSGMFYHLAVNDGVVPVVDDGAVAGQDHPVAVLEIADGIGERTERDRIRAQIHLALAIADGERRSVARADHQIGVAGEDKPQRKSAAQLRQRRPHRLDRRDAFCQKTVDEVQHDLGVGLGLEHGAEFFELLAQVAKILDDAVVDHGDAIGGVRMGVVLGRLAVGGPAGVSDAGMAGERFCLQPRFEVFQFAFGAAALEMLALQRRNASGIVAAIFESLERIHDLVRDRTAPQNADNAAHAV